MENTMERPNFTTLCILAFAASVSLGAVAGQDTPAQDNKPASKASDKKATDSKTADDKTSTRNRIGDSSGAMVHASDQKFMTDAARGGMMEVQLGQAAQQKASSDAVKELGKKIAQDHTQINQELADLAKMKSVSLPSDLGNHQAAMDKISNQSGAAFDKAYTKAMVRDHKKDVKEFERISSNAMDSDVKAFAAKTLPTLKEHLRMAEELDKNKPAASTAPSTAPSSTPKQ
jgi:putative membrane protein